MIKSELVLKIAEQNPHLYQRDVETLVNAILDTIADALAQGDRVELRGFGAFSVKRREAGAGATPAPASRCPCPRRRSPSSRPARRCACVSTAPASATSSRALDRQPSRHGEVAGLRFGAPLSPAAIHFDGERSSSAI